MIRPSARQTPFRLIGAILALALAGGLLARAGSLSPAALAAEPVYALASRVGLVLPPGFAASHAFPGFEDRARNGVIRVTELPAEAYPTLEREMTADVLKRRGIVFERREALPTAAGEAFVVVGTQSVNGVSVRQWVATVHAEKLTAVVTVQMPNTGNDPKLDGEIIASLRTVTVRASVPVEEQLAALPFKLDNLAGFRIVRMIVGSAVVLTDGPKDVIEFNEQPLLLITAARGAPSGANDRNRFARAAFAQTPSLRDIRFVRMEPQRVRGQPGHEIVAEAKDATTGTDIMVVQWLRFGSVGHLRILGIARKDAWGTIFDRFRAVRDGLRLK